MNLRVGVSKIKVQEGSVGLPGGVAGERRNMGGRNGSMVVFGSRGVGGKSGLGLGNGSGLPRLNMR